jgi:hypothetical protein
MVLCKFLWKLFSTNLTTRLVFPAPKLSVLYPYSKVGKAVQHKEIKARKGRIRALWVVYLELLE